MHRGDGCQIQPRCRLDERPLRRGATHGSRVRLVQALTPLIPPKTHTKSTNSQYGRKYDPIYYASTSCEDSSPQTLTIFNERGLELIAVPWPWAIALKLVRYAKQDPADCAAVLRLGVAQCGIRWTLASLEQWIMESCWPMGYSCYQPPQRALLRARIQDLLSRAFPRRTSCRSAVRPLGMTREPSFYLLR